MYKWQLQSAIGRGRPAAASVSRVADGIASTLRAFSISAKQYEDTSKPTRAERSQAASQEISSLPKGVDARSFAAKSSTSTPKLVIRREVLGSAGRGSSTNNGRGGFRGRGGPSTGGFRGRGGARGGIRGGARGGAHGGDRGGARGGMRGRGRGGARGPRKRRGGRRPEADDSEDVPLTAEEKEYIRIQTYGVDTIYEAGSKTTVEGLKGTAPAFSLTSDGTRSLQATVQDRLNISADRNSQQYILPEELIRRYATGKDILFTSEEEKTKVLNYWADRRQRTAEAAGKEYKPPVLNGLSEIEKATMLQSLTAGQYQTLKDIGKGDVMAGIEVFTLKNETYLPSDGAKLMEKVKALLPVAKPAVAAKGAKPAAKK